MGVGTNAAKLRTVVQAFKIPVTSIAEVVGTSRPYVARVLSANDDFEGSPQFWLAVERNLARIVEARHGQIFDVAAVGSEQVHALAGIKASLVPAPNSIPAKAA